MATTDGRDTVGMMRQAQPQLVICQTSCTDWTRKGNSRDLTNWWMDCSNATTVTNEETGQHWSPRLGLRRGLFACLSYTELYIGRGQTGQLPQHLVRHHAFGFP